MKLSKKKQKYDDKVQSLTADKSAIPFAALVVVVLLIYYVIDILNAN